MKSIFWKKTAVILAAGIVSVGLLVGCGNAQKQETTASSAAGGKRNVKLVIANNEPPLDWKDENGKLHGYEYDIWLEVNKKLKNYNLNIDAVAPETMDVMMESGEAQVASEGYYRNAQREKNFLIPKSPIGASSLVAYVKKGDETKYKDLNDIVKAKLRIAPLTPNGGAFRILTEWNEKNGKPLAEIPVQNNFSFAEAVHGLKEGQFDVIIRPNNLGIEDAAKKEGVELAEIEKPIKVNETIVLVNKNEKELSAEIDDALKALRDDGTLKKISEKWYKKDLFEQLQQK